MVYPQPWLSWAQLVLQSIGAPVGEPGLTSLWLWSGFESGADRMRWNNPLNTTLQCCGWVANMNSVGVKRYPTPQAGALATVQTLLNGRYGPIVSKLRNGVPADRGTWADCAQALQTWGTGISWLPQTHVAQPDQMTPEETAKMAWLEKTVTQLWTGTDPTGIPPSQARLQAEIDALKNAPAGGALPSGTTLTVKVV